MVKTVEQLKEMIDDIKTQLIEDNYEGEAYTTTIPGIEFPYVQALNMFKEYNRDGIQFAEHMYINLTNIETEQNETWDLLVTFDIEKLK